MSTSKPPSPERDQPPAATVGTNSDKEQCNYSNNLGWSEWHYGHGRAELLPDVDALPNHGRRLTDVLAD
eukprot:6226734-Heterocapsa_arctica.AAC.1